MTRRFVDFAAHARQPMAGWLMLIVGATLLAAAIGCQQHWQHQEDQKRQRQIAAAEELRQRKKPPPRLEPTSAERREESTRRQLGHPWLATLRTVEAATQDPIYLRSLSIEPSAGVVKLEADAPSFDHALAYLQVLDLGGVLRPGRMLAHEQVAGATPDQVTVRFSAETQWSAR